MYGEVERVRVQNDRFYDAFSHRNLLRMEQLWSHSEYVRCVHPGAPLLVGWNSVRESWRGLFARSIVVTARPKETRVTVIGPTALVTCHEATSSFTLNGSTAYYSETTNVFEKLNGDWLLIHHHASLVSKAGDAFWLGSID
jgi:ketosteroid isomerase-like protein